MNVAQGDRRRRAAGWAGNQAKSSLRSTHLDADFDVVDTGHVVQRNLEDMRTWICVRQLLVVGVAEFDAVIHACRSIRSVLDLGIGRCQAGVSAVSTGGMIGNGRVGGW